MFFTSESVACHNFFIAHNIQVLINLVKLHQKMCTNCLASPVASGQRTFQDFPSDEKDIPVPSISGVGLHFEENISPNVNRSSVPAFNTPGTSRCLISAKRKQRDNALKKMNTAMKSVKKLGRVAQPFPGSPLPMERRLFKSETKTKKKKCSRKSKKRVYAVRETIDFMADFFSKILPSPRRVAATPITPVAPVALAHSSNNSPPNLTASDQYSCQSDNGNDTLSFETQEDDSGIASLPEDLVGPNLSTPPRTPGAELGEQWSTMVAEIKSSSTYPDKGANSSSIEVDITNAKLASPSSEELSTSTEGETRDVSPENSRCRPNSVDTRKISLGTNVRKITCGIGRDGSVIKAPENGINYCRIKYEDGSEEDFTVPQMEEHITYYQKYHESSSIEGETAFAAWSLGTRVRKVFGDKGYDGVVVNVPGDGIYYFKILYEDGDEESFNETQMEEHTVYYHMHHRPPAKGTDIPSEEKAKLPTKSGSSSSRKEKKKKYPDFEREVIMAKAKHNYYPAKIVPGSSETRDGDEWVCVQWISDRTREYRPIDQVQIIKQPLRARTNTIGSRKLTKPRKFGDLVDPDECVRRKLI